MCGSLYICGPWGNVLLVCLRAVDCLFVRACAIETDIFTSQPVEERQCTPHETLVILAQYRRKRGARFVSILLSVVMVSYSQLASYMQVHENYAKALFREKVEKEGCPHAEHLPPFPVPDHSGQFQRYKDVKFELWYGGDDWLGSRLPVLRTEQQDKHLSCRHVGSHTVMSLCLVWLI